MFFKRKVVPTHSKLFKYNVSFYWSEKIWLFIDYLQIYGLLWNMSQSWGWPYIWIKWTTWTVWFNIDYFSTSEHGAYAGSTQSFIDQYGEMNNYLTYALVFSLVPGGIMLGVLLSRRVTGLYGVRYDVYEASIRYWALLCLQLLYVPCCLAVFRIYYCEDGILSVDPSHKCLDIYHIQVVVVSLICILPLYIGLPYIVYKMTENIVIYDLTSDHESRLQAWELERVFDLDTFWETSQLWMISSFNRQGVYFRFYILLFKSSLLFIYLFLRFNSIFQSVMFWFLTTYVFVKTISLLPYRVSSSNMIVAVLAGLGLINSTFAMCNAFGVENSIMVSSVESVWLLSFNVIGLFIILIVVALSITGQLDRWPTSLTLKRISRSSKWSVMVKWIDCIEESNMINSDVLLCPPEVADILALEESIRQLRKSWMSASSLGSVFTVILSDHLTRLMITHAIISPKAIRGKEYWDREYLKSGREMFNIRDKKYKLWNERKKRILLKLLALTAFVGRRVIRKTRDYERDRHGAPLTIRRRFSLMGTRSMDDLRPGPPSEGAEGWTSEHKFLELKNKIEILTANTEKILRVGDTDNTDDVETGRDMLPQSKLVEDKYSELCEIYDEWDEVIRAYESRELAGGGKIKNELTEDWYTYRHAASNALDALRTKLSNEQQVDQSSNELAEYSQSDEGEKENQNSSEKNLQKNNMFFSENGAMVKLINV